MNRVFFLVIALTVGFISFAGASEVPKILSQIGKSKDQKLREIAQTGEEGLRLITSAHTKVFSRENIIANKISFDEKKSWQDVILWVQKYIDKNKDGAFVALLAKLTDASTALLDVLQDSYRKYLEPAVADKVAGLSGNINKLDLCKIKNIAALETAAKNFKKKYIGDTQKVQTALNARQKDLSKNITAYLKKLILTAADKAKLYVDALRLYQTELLMRLALTLETTIDKVDRDAQRIVKLYAEKCKK